MGCCKSKVVAVDDDEGKLTEEERLRNERLERQRARAAKRTAAPPASNNDIASMVEKKVMSAAMGASPAKGGRAKAGGKMGSARSSWEPTPPTATSAPVDNYDD